MRRPPKQRSVSLRMGGHRRSEEESPKPIIKLLRGRSPLLLPPKKPDIDGRRWSGRRKKRLKILSCLSRLSVGRVGKPRGSLTFCSDVRPRKEKRVRSFLSKREDGQREWRSYKMENPRHFCRFSLCYNNRTISAVPLMASFPLARHHSEQIQ